MTTPDQTSQQPNGSTSLALSTHQERAIELREQIGADDTTPRAIVPRTFAEAQSFAGALAHSSLVPEALRSRAPDILMIVLAGAELAIPPIKAITLFHVIEGVPKLSADGLAAVCARSPLCEYLEPREQGNERVTWATKRHGRPEMIMSYSLAEANLAGLIRATRSGAPGNWQKFPRNMMNARCKADLCRMIYPEICAGLLTAEEARDIVDADSTETKSTGFSAPTPPQAPAAPPATATSSPGTPPRRGPGRPPNASKPIDVAATETPTQGASGSPAAPATSPTVNTTGSSPLPPDAARDQAFTQASANAKTLEESRRANPPQASTPSSAPPPSSLPVVPPANSVPAAQPSSSPTAPASSSAGGGDDDGSGFGDEEPTRTISMFEAEVRAAVDAKAPAQLEALKPGWMAWSKLEGPGGGKEHAHKMREIFQRAKLDLGIR